MASGGWSVLITCEHARFAVPPELELGVADEVLRSHIGYDRGSSEIATALAARLGAPLHRGRFTRLVVDLNRRERNPAVIRAESYGVPIPGNAGLSEPAREARLAAYHRPYRHAARADAVRRAEAGGCLHLSIHSFDPAVDPPNRRFDAGVLFDPDREPEATVAARVADGLAKSGRAVRLNEPYAGVPEGLTSWLRDQLPAARYVGLEIEASQGWMDGAAALEAFAHDLAGVVDAVRARLGAFPAG
jgi:predicted N-formylglutamate amidohydrolase